jgi:hypothetical protein
MATEDETLEIEQEGRARDKKAGLNRVPSKSVSGEPLSEPIKKVLSPTVAADVSEFVPVKRLDDDTPGDEDYTQKDKRLKAEKAEEEKIVARMPEVRQLGVAAGRCAEDLKEARRQLKMYERHVATYTKKVADAEALLMARLEELRRVGL